MDRFSKLCFLNTDEEFFNGKKIKLKDVKWIKSVLRPILDKLYGKKIKDIYDLNITKMKNKTNMEILGYMISFYRVMDVAVKQNMDVDVTE